jgi:leader peptidase (prepilin peptidase)/N-methyltransferase
MIRLMPQMFVALFGLALGSFLNVCIHRLPAGQSIFMPGSRCPACGHPIRWFDNVPLLSYLVLRGRCRDCRARVSPVYPCIELLTAALLVADFAEYGWTPQFIKWAVFSLFVLILIFTDLRERQIPHSVTLSGIALGLVLSGWIPVDGRPLGAILARLGVFWHGPLLSVAGALAGALLGGGLFYAVGEAFYRLRHKEGLGFGDVMLMLMVGTFLGPALTLTTVFLGSLLGTVVALPLSLLARRFREYQWPYGTFLGIAAIYVSLGGEALLNAYLRWGGLR